MKRSLHIATLAEADSRNCRTVAATERGIALVIVLWIVTALTILVLSFNASVRSHIDVTTSELGISHSEAATAAAIRLAVYKLQEPDIKRRWKPDGRTYNANVVGRSVSISIQDEQGLVDINGADADLLGGILSQHVEQLDTVRRLAARIVDWRDPDSKTTPGGAEDPAYAAAGIPGGAGDRPFTALIELQSVLGITPELGARLSPEFTVFNGSSKLNLLTASRQTLRALPQISEENVNQILRLRQGEIKPDDLLALFPKWQKYLSTTSGPAYRIRIDVTDPNIVPSASQVTILLLEEGGNPFHVLDWQELRPRPR